MVAAAALPGSDVTIEGVGLNPTRTGIIDVLRAMDADITVSGQSLTGGEPTGDIRVRGGSLKGTVIEGDLVVRAIDELPAISAAALMAEGETTIRDAAELRVKEVDRIAVVANELRKLGADIEEQPDGLVIQGGQALDGAVLSSEGDHRIGMMAAVAALFAKGESKIEGEACIADSFPGFAATLARLGANLA
jgi:3-phosphoshikimate 1-carboxyvinyltransferase